MSVVQKGDSNNDVDINWPIPYVITNCLSQSVSQSDRSPYRYRYNGLPVELDLYTIE